MSLRAASHLFVLWLALPAAGCASHAGTATTGEHTLHPGERVVLDGATLTYVGVAQDSRCPPDVQCIHAGSADVRLHYRGTGDERDIVLRTGGTTTATVDRHRLQLLDLSFGAAPAVTLRIQPLP